MSFLKKGLRRIFPVTITERDVAEIHDQLQRQSRAQDAQLHLQARLLINEQRRQRTELLADIKKAEFKVYSQWGDDGIIQFLVRETGIQPQEEQFIEFGVQDYTESNTRFLLTFNNWRGLVMDGGQQHIDYIRQDEIHWRYDLTAACEFITRENVNALFQKYNFTGDIGLLHIDIDGNDYWVWQAVDCVNPVIVVVEYNALWGADNYWTVPYKSDFFRGSAHFSYQYYGASVSAFCHLAQERGYAFVGCNSNGNNAYFVRRDRLGELRELSPREGFVMSRFRDTRDPSGNLSFLSGAARFEVMRGANVVDVRTGETLTL